MKNRIPRIYINSNLKINQNLDLFEHNVHYIKKVLRMKIKDKLEIFNNTNYVFFAEIINIKKNEINVKIFQNELKNTESCLYTHLGQVISKNKKMDFAIQKSVEMGVNSITPLFSQYCVIQKKKIISQKK